MTLQKHGGTLPKNEKNTDLKMEKNTDLKMVILQADLRKHGTKQ